MKKYWINKYTQLWKDPGARYKVCDLPIGTIVEKSGMETGNYLPVKYNASKNFEGWVYFSYLEELFFLSPEMIDIENKTTSDQDMAQYMIWEGNVQYNLCGELAICHVFDRSLKELLDGWKAKSPTVYNRIFYGGRSRTTGIPDLLDMAAALGEFQHMTTTEAFMDSKSGRVLFSPARIINWQREEWKLILGCKIGGPYGRLKASGIAHWISLVNVIPDGPENAVVTLYNSSSNRVETYSWYEFVSSVKTPYGVLIKSKGDKHDNP
jgi:hypothetical protein